jgi:hypothetical protein
MTQWMMFGFGLEWNLIALFLPIFLSLLAAPAVEIV